MPIAAVEKPAWDLIDTVLLDLDGTLLDLAFDNYFWLELIPAAYAASRSMTVEQARAALVPRFRACEGTLAWYCVEHWSRELGLDVAALKRAAAGRISWLPGARDFLRRLRAGGKRLVLLTNAHPSALRIKDEHMGITRHVDAAFSSHVFGAPKESPDFWAAVRAVEPFDRQRTLFVDDSPAVLRAAHTAGIGWIYGVRHPDSSRAARAHEEFPSVESVSDLGP
jgi:putative hydrolase of the HAD superfamily